MKWTLSLRVEFRSRVFETLTSLCKLLSLITLEGIVIRNKAGNGWVLVKQCESLLVDKSMGNYIN